MGVCIVERIPPGGDELEHVGAYREDGDAFVVYGTAVVLDNGVRYYLIDSWIFEIFIPTVSMLKNLVIRDKDSQEKHTILAAKIEGHKIGEEGYMWQISIIPKSKLGNLPKIESVDSPGVFDFLE